MLLGIFEVSIKVAGFSINTTNGDKVKISNVTKNPSKPESFRANVSIGKSSEVIEFYFKFIDEWHSKPIDSKIYILFGGMNGDTADSASEIVIIESVKCYKREKAMDEVLVKMMEIHNYISSQGSIFNILEDTKFEELGNTKAMTLFSDKKVFLLSEISTTKFKCTQTKQIECPDKKYCI